MDIQFSVNNQYIMRTDNNYIAARSKNYLHAVFTFSSEWDNVTALFTCGENSYAVSIKENRCQVPWEVLAQPGSFKVSVFCGDLITANSAVVIVNESGYSEEILEPLTPTPTVWEEYHSAVVQLSQNAQLSAESAENSEKSANSYAQSAASSSLSAEESASMASSAETVAVDAAASAQTEAQRAQAMKNEAQSFAESAENSKNDAYSAKATIESYIGDSQKISEAINSKQDKLTFDSIPMAGSNNPVTSDGIHHIMLNFSDTINDITVRLDDETKNLNIVEEQIVSLDDSVTQNANLISNKADKTDIQDYTFEDIESIGLSLDKNVEKRYGTLYSVTINGADSSDDFIAGLSFNSGDTPTKIDGISIIWNGIDCTDKTFTPQKNTHYDIVFYHNGLDFVGLVNGYSRAVTE